MTRTPDKRLRPYGTVYEIPADTWAEFQRRVNGAITQASAIAASLKSLTDSLRRMRDVMKGGDDGTETNEG